jgi:IclR family transcriptional regulator, acetate operon repressor
MSVKGGLGRTPDDRRQVRRLRRGHLPTRGAVTRTGIIRSSEMSDADRTAQLLGLVIDRSPRPLDELVAEAGAGEPEVRAALEALERHGLIEWDADGEVGDGPRLRFARSGEGRRQLAELAEPAMRRLAEESGETVNLMVHTPQGAEAVAQVDGRHVLGASNWIGRPVPNHCSAAGKVFLAFGRADSGGPLEALTARTIVHPDQLARDLEQVRARGFATIVDELEMGLTAVAAPIRDGAGTVVGALSVAGPTARLGPSRLAIVGRLAIEQADGLSARLGYARG